MVFDPPASNLTKPVSIYECSPDNVILQDVVHSRSFPQEIYEMIIDTIAAASEDASGDEGAERQTLKACALTCKQFLGRSRQHLFGTLFLSHKKDAATLQTAYGPSRLGLYVTTLKIWDPPGERDHDHPGTPGPIHWLASFIPMLSQLPNVTTLYLYNLNWAMLGSATRSSIIRHFSNITSLVMVRVNVWTSNQGLRILRSFPHLKTLDLGGVHWEYPNHTQKQLAVQSALDLDFLIICDGMDVEIDINPWTVPMAHWLLAPRPLCRIRAAELHWGHGNWPLLMAILRKLSPSLEELTLHLYTRFYDPPLWKHEAEWYTLEDNEMSDGETSSNEEESGAQRAQLESEARHHINEDEALPLFVGEFDRNKGLQALDLRRVIISLGVDYNAATVPALLDWVSSLPVSTSLELTISLHEGGAPYEHLDEMDSGIARNVEEWRTSSRKVSFCLYWPRGEERHHTDGMPWNEFLCTQSPRLREMGVAFEGNGVTLDLPGSPDPVDDPLLWRHVQVDGGN